MYKIILVCFLLQAASFAEGQVLTTDYSLFHQQKIQNVPFYSITKNGRTSYVFGTLHIAVDYRDLPRVVIRKLMTANRVYFEYINRRYNDSGCGVYLQQGIEFQRKLFALQYPRQRYNSEDEVAQLSAVGWDPEIARVLPLDSVSDFGYHLWFPPNFWKSHIHLDNQLACIGALADRKMQSLESQEVRRQAYVFQNLVKRVQQASAAISDIIWGPKAISHPKTARPASDMLGINAKTLREYLLQPELVRANYSAVSKLLDEYRSFWSMPVSKIFEASTESNPEETNLRNLSWMQVIGDQPEGGNIFIAVGLNHLYGPFGLLKLFSNQGYDVQLVPQHEVGDSP